MPVMPLHVAVIIRILRSPESGLKIDKNSFLNFIRTAHIVPR